MAYKPSPKTATPADTAVRCTSRKSLGTVCDCVCGCVLGRGLVCAPGFDGLLGSGCSLSALYSFGK